MGFVSDPKGDEKQRYKKKMKDKHLMSFPLIKKIFTHFARKI